MRKKQQCPIIQDGIEKQLRSFQLKQQCLLYLNLKNQAAYGNVCLKQNVKKHKLAVQGLLKNVRVAFFIG